MTLPNIEPVRLSPNLIHFYWGRDAEHPNMDMRLGGGNHVIYSGDEAIVIDSMNLAPQGQWVRDYMTREHGVTRFRLVNTHWHADHIGENHVYEDCAIIGHEDTRVKMIEYKHELENGAEQGVPPLKVVLPNITFRGRMDLWCGNIKVELHEFTIHALGHISVYLPDQKTLLAADMLEDPIWIFSFGFAPPHQQIAEFERMALMDLEHIYPTHGDLTKIRNGGYSKTFIQRSIDYLDAMMAAKDKPDFQKRDALSYIDDGVKADDLHWWQPYEEVHKLNIKTLINFNC